MKDMPVNMAKKMLLSIMVTVIAALLIAGIAFVLVDAHLFRHSLERELQVRARIVGLNAASAMFFDDPVAAAQDISALQYDPHLIQARLLTAAGEDFARHPDSPLSNPSRRLTVRQPIEMDGNVVGFIKIESTLGALYERIRLYLLNAALVLIVAGLIALPMAVFQQRMITGPISQLAEAVRQVSQTRDYSQRAPSMTGNELSILSTGINELLERIETHKSMIDAQAGELRQSRAMLAKVLDSVPLQIFWHDTEGRYIGCNQKHAESLGCRHTKELVGQPLGFRADKRISQQELEEDRVIIAEKQPLPPTIERRLQADGEVRWLQRIKVPIMDSEGNVSAILGVYEDITESRRAEELRVAKEAADRANQAKSAFLANMSHEFRTPLNAVLGFAQLLQRDADCSPRQHKHLETINSSGQHLLNLINDILEMSKIEAGRIVLNPSDFDVVFLVHEVLDMFQPAAQQRGISLRIESDLPSPCHLRGDERKIRQILINLVGNAIKFTQQGHVIVRAACDENIDTGLRLSLEVEDTGPGIPADEIECLFASFQQTRIGRESGKGTGLGLTISREYALLMDGDITVTSQEGKGATFRCDLRVDAAEAVPVRKEQELNDWMEIESDGRAIDDELVPPVALLEELLQWVLMGDMSSVSRAVRKLADEQPEYGMFATRICEWADAFEDHPLEIYLRAHMQQQEDDSLASTRNT